MTISQLTPSRAARRQTLRDRVAEYLTEHGALPENAEAYARDLLDLVDELGFALPPAIDDPPPAPEPSTPEGRARARQIYAETRAAKCGLQPNTATSPVDQTQPAAHTE